MHRMRMVSYSYSSKWRGFIKVSPTTSTKDKRSRGRTDDFVHLRRSHTNICLILPTLPSLSGLKDIGFINLPSSRTLIIFLGGYCSGLRSRTQHGTEAPVTNTTGTHTAALMGVSTLMKPLPSSNIIGFPYKVRMQVEDLSLHPFTEQHNVTGSSTSTSIIRCLKNKCWPMAETCHFSQQHSTRTGTIEEQVFMGTLLLL